MTTEDDDANDDGPDGDSLSAAPTSSPEPLEPSPGGPKREGFRIERRTIIFAALLLSSIAVFAWLSYSGAPPKRRPARERGRAVRVFTAQPIDMVPRIVGYGVVEAQRTWQAVTEVGGTIIEMNPQLEIGRRVSEGTLLYRIDPESFELEKSRTEATVMGVQAQIEELKAREKSAEASLELEEKALDLARKDLERARKALAAGVGSQTDVETAEKAVIAAEKAVQAHRNTLLELPAQRKVLAAQIAQQQTGVEGARMDLAKTEVYAPFTMRIREVNASLHQAVSAGQVVVVGDGIDVMEVAAQMPVGAIGPLLGPRATPGPTGEASTDEPDRALPSAEPDGSAGGTAAPQPSAPPRPTGGRTSSIEAIIRLKTQGVESSWTGRFRRFQGVDPATRTSGIVVEVAEPRRRAGGGPPLLPGLHVEVELRGAKRTGCLAIPRSALFDDRVYVVGEDDRLVVRDVETELLQEQYACIGDGLKAGERVVLTELTPAVEGMLLVPRDDDTVTGWLEKLASGDGEQGDPPAPVRPAPGASSAP